MHPDAVSVHGLTCLCGSRHGRPARCCRLRRSQQKYREQALAQDLARHRRYERVMQAAVAVKAHDDQVGVAGLGGFEDARRRATAIAAATSLAPMTNAR